MTRQPQPDPPAPFAALRSVARHSLLVVAGAPADTVYLVHSGQARAFLLHASGRETTTALLGPGHVAGIAPFVGRRTYHSFVQAITPLEVWALPSGPLLDELARNSDLLLTMLPSLSRRLALTQQLLRDITLLPVAERLVAAVDDLTQSLGGQRPALTRQALAAMIGARPETVSRVHALPRARPAPRRAA